MARPPHHPLIQRKATPLAVRYAIYLTSPRHAPLTEAARRWLGRCAFTGAETAPEAPAAANPAVPARYGFHATMRAPFRLADGHTEAELCAAFGRFAAAEGTIPATLEVASLGNFVALVAPDQRRIAGAHEGALEAFESFRAPLDAAEIARRKPDRLDARGQALLDAYGYPHVLERFRFHMTLSGPVEPAAQDAVREAAAAYFAPFTGSPQSLHFALFAEPEAGGPFTIIAESSAAAEAAR